MLSKSPHRCACVAVCADFELKEGRRPALADMEQLQGRAQQLGREAAAQVAAQHPGKPLPRETVTEDVLPVEVRATAPCHTLPLWPCRGYPVCVQSDRKICFSALAW